MSYIKHFYYQWHFLNSCNLRCKHCYQFDYSANDNSFEDLIYVAEKIVKSATVWNKQGRVALTGGEPLLSPHLYSLMDFFEKSAVISCLTILSNGTLISDDFIKNVKLFKKLREIQISLDGSSRETHDFIRGKGAFDLSIDGIKSLVASCVPVSIMFTLSRSNLHEIPAILDVALSLGVDFITIERVTPCGNNKLSDSLLTKDEICQAYCAINEWEVLHRKVEKKLHIRRSRPLWALTNKDLGGFCPVGISSLAILHDGTILPCRRLEIPIGNVFVDGGLFRSWYTSSLLWDVRNRAQDKSTCSSCDLLFKCGGCRAIAHAVTGNYMDGDPQCWKI